MLGFSFLFSAFPGLPSASRKHSKCRETPTVIVCSPSPNSRPWHKGYRQQSRDIITSIDPMYYRSESTFTGMTRGQASGTIPSQALGPIPASVVTTAHFMLPVPSSGLPMHDLIKCSHTLGVRMLAFPLYR